MLLGCTALVAGVAGFSSAATQFVAWRVGYHPALGQPWFGRIYAPWSWIEWQQAAWAPNAKATFGIVDSALMAAAALGMLACLVIANGRRRKPVKHEGVHGTARFQSELEIRRWRPAAARRNSRMRASMSAAGPIRQGRVHYLRHDGPEHCIVIAPTRSGKGVGNILPTLLSWPASCAVYDEKGELWAADRRLAGAGRRATS